MLPTHNAFTSFRDYFPEGTEVTFRLELAWLSWRVYSPDQRDLPPGWTSVALIENSDGFRAEVFENYKQMRVMAICGAQDEADFWDCQSVYKGQVPAQFLSLASNLEYWSDVRLLVGHSLGGVLAKLGSLLLNSELYAVAFNAPGLGAVVAPFATQKAECMITNYVIGNDFLGCYGRHLGKIRVLPEVGLGQDIFCAHRAWHVLAKGEHLEDAQPDFDKCLTFLASNYPESLAVKYLLDSDLVDLVTLARLVDPQRFQDGLLALAEGVLGSELPRTRIGRLLRSQFRAV